MSTCRCPSTAAPIPAQRPRRVPILAALRRKQGHPSPSTRETTLSTTAQIPQRMARRARVATQLWRRGALATPRPRAARNAWPVVRVRFAFWVCAGARRATAVLWGSHAIRRRILARQPATASIPFATGGAASMRIARPGQRNPRAGQVGSNVQRAASFPPASRYKMSGEEAVANARRIAIVTATKMVVSASVFLVEQALAAV